MDMSDTAKVIKIVSKLTILRAIDRFISEVKTTTIKKIAATSADLDIVMTAKYKSEPRTPHFTSCDLLCVCSKRKTLATLARTQYAIWFGSLKVPE